ncbi:30S ribosomal protein S20 [Myxococcota bacterium]|nr:30S ribosomal protein S20 [Myxococcota bacterium]
MANHKSAMKRARQTIKRTIRNTAIRSRISTVSRTLREAITAGDADKIKEALNAATREIRKAVTKGVLKKETGSRRVSRMVLAANKTRS